MSEDMLRHPWTVHGCIDWNLWCLEFTTFSRTVADYDYQCTTAADMLHNVWVPLIAFFVAMHVQYGYGIFGLKLLVHSLFYGQGHRVDALDTLGHVGRLLEFYTDKEALQARLPCMERVLDALTMYHVRRKRFLVPDPKTGMLCISPYLPT